MGLVPSNGMQDPPPFSFAPILMKDAHSAESNEKLFLLFFNFLSYGCINNLTKIYYFCHYFKGYVKNKCYALDTFAMCMSNQPCAFSDGAHVCDTHTCDCHMYVYVAANRRN